VRALLRIDLYEVTDDGVVVRGQRL
jgi:hypothetical protein